MVLLMATYIHVRVCICVCADDGCTRQSSSSSSHYQISRYPAHFCWPDNRKGVLATSKQVRDAMVYACVLVVLSFAHLFAANFVCNLSIRKLT